MNVTGRKKRNMPHAFVTNESGHLLCCLCNMFKHGSAAGGTLLRSAFGSYYSAFSEKPKMEWMLNTVCIARTKSVRGPGDASARFTLILRMCIVSPSLLVND